MSQAGRIEAWQNTAGVTGRGYEEAFHLCADALGIAANESTNGRLVLYLQNITNTTLTSLPDLMGETARQLNVDSWNNVGSNIEDLHYGPNLLTNGGFDASLTGWTVVGTSPAWTGAESPPSSGNYVALLSGTVPTGQTRSFNQTITVENGATYRIDAEGNNGFGGDLDVNAQASTVFSITDTGAYTLNGEFVAVGTSANIEVITTQDDTLYLGNMDQIRVRKKLS